MWLIVPSIRSYTFVTGLPCECRWLGPWSYCEREHPLAIDLFHGVKLDPEIGCNILDVRQDA
jgi:hypothetical protein